MPIAQGGMAEIFFARQEGPQGFQKTVVVKRVLPQFVSESDFIEMFLDEARLAALLSHPNVVQVFDFGEDDGSYYLAMEYLNGEDLSHVLRTLRRRQEYMPFDVVASIVADAAAGLHHAHTLANEAGDPLHIVHRDVSPSNVFLTHQGVVKVLDFGIAKAEGKLLKTKTGVLKGKHLYMSPEQIRAEPLTAQSDVFALGAVMYEMLTGVRPFQRDSEIAALQAILAEPIQPLSAHRSDVPASLSDICMRCLERDLAARTKSADALRGELIGALGSAVGPDRVRSYMRYVFGADAAQKKLERLQPPDEGATVNLGSDPKVLADTKATLAPLPPPSPSSATALSRRPLLLGAAAALALCTVGAAAFLLGSARSEPTSPLAALPPASSAPSLPEPETAAPAPPDAPSPSEPAAAEPSAAEPAVAAKSDPGAADETTTPPDGPAAPEQAAQAKKPAPKKQTKSRARRGRAGKPAAAPSQTATTAAPAERGFLTVNCIPWCRVFVDGKDTGKDSPVKGMPLSPGRHSLKLVNPPTGKSEERSVEVVAGETVKALVRF